MAGGSGPGSEPGGEVYPDGPVSSPTLSVLPIRVACVGESYTCLTLTRGSRAPDIECDDEGSAETPVRRPPPSRPKAGGILPPWGSRSLLLSLRACQCHLRTHQSTLLDRPQARLPVLALLWQLRWGPAHGDPEERGGHVYGPGAAHGARRRGPGVQQARGVGPLQGNGARIAPRSPRKPPSTGRPCHHNPP